MARNQTQQAVGVAQLPSNIPATKIADGSVSDDEFQYMNTVTSNIQTQIAAKATDLGFTKRVLTFTADGTDSVTNSTYKSPSGMAAQTITGMPAGNYVISVEGESYGSTSSSSDGNVRVSVTGATTIQTSSDIFRNDGTKWINWAWSFPAIALSAGDNAFAPQFNKSGGSANPSVISGVIWRVTIERVS